MSARLGHPVHPPVGILAHLWAVMVVGLCCLCIASILTATHKSCNYCSDQEVLAAGPCADNWTIFSKWLGAALTVWTLLLSTVSSVIAVGFYSKVPLCLELGRIVHNASASLSLELFSSLLS